MTDSDPPSARPPNPAPNRTPKPTRAGLETAGSQLFAPWRLSYLEMLKADEVTSQRASEPEGGAAASAEAEPKPKPACFLREYWLNPDDDEANLVVARTGREELALRNGGRGGMIMLNRYPYTNGHLLVTLGQSRMRLLDYTAEQRAELWSLVDLATHLVERTLMPQGVNVGINQGAAAGAGVPEHLHVHVVPRWAGDVNFMDVVGRVRIIPSALEDMYRRLREAWLSASS